jgi:hypothetical protein
MAMTDTQLRALAGTWLAISNEIGKQGALALALGEPIEEITSRIGQMASLKFCAQALLKFIEAKQETPFTRRDADVF